MKVAQTLKATVKKKICRLGDLAAGIFAPFL
jgi:hypothetical protein